MNDPNQFVEDEDEDTLSFSVRISAQYLILVCILDWKLCVLLSWHVLTYLFWFILDALWEIQECISETVQRCRAYKRERRWVESTRRFKLVTLLFVYMGTWSCWFFSVWIVSLVFRWKYYEVCLLCIGYIQQDIIEQLETGKLKEEFKHFMKQILISSCSDAGGKINHKNHSRCFLTLIILKYFVNEWNLD